jgi:hypothetical protein
MQSIVKTVKLTKPVAAALARAAQARECTESDLIREGIRRVLETEEGLDMVTAIGADLGVGRGPSDLSSNRRRLSGYGRSRNR